MIKIFNLLEVDIFFPEESFWIIDLTEKLFYLLKFSEKWDYLVDWDQPFHFFFYFFSWSWLEILLF